MRIFRCSYILAQLLSVKGNSENRETVTLSGRSASSIVSRRPRASEYDPSRTSSSTCSLHDFIRNCHMVLPSAAACARSVGVVMRKRGDLAEGDGVKRRIVELADGGGTVCIDVEDDVAEENGKGSVWTGRREGA